MAGVCPWKVRIAIEESDLADWGCASSEACEIPGARGKWRGAPETSLLKMAMALGRDR